MELYESCLNHDLGNLVCTCKEGKIELLMKSRQANLECPQREFVLLQFYFCRGYGNSTKSVSRESDSVNAKQCNNHSKICKMSFN